MRLYPLVVLIMLTLLPGVPAQAGDRGTPDEAKALAIKAARYLRQAGPETAYPAFNAKDGPWHDRDLSVLVMTSGSVILAHGGMPAFVGKSRDLSVLVMTSGSMILAHGGMPAFVGKSIASLKDVDGNSVAAKILAVTDSGWAEYKWRNPVSKMIEPKLTYVVTVGDNRVAVGAYK
jgi:hypothetical protein